ncbi:hypothetical protein D092_04210 [Rhodococcus ruber Chol-4]|uniref:phospholipase D-like domain-containing protein n=1 Tax=Rhodococcus ruber TaxID=1830 RepID=UPI0003449353|nr:phospholipase D-like domain-containing protein [Rhodococcus ruber]KXF88252.1 hypothetical protein D092_04210 [Rhodococcus ruber Chol-4]
MTRARFELHSPLTLLHEWDNGPLREVLITGYTLDLVFFERHCVPIARALGARVTVLSDAHQPVHDAADVRYAGRTYQQGNVGCRGAFHPKLAVLVGDDDVWVAIGSGNPTTSGWGHNDELWLVIRSPRTVGPAALVHLSEWLRTLPTVVSMPSWIADTLHVLAESITPEQVDNSLPELSIVGNLHRPIIERLPQTRMRSLHLSAPFFDPASAAVAALTARMTPEHVVVALQETVSWYDGATLVDATAAVPSVEFRFLDETRTSHGKLVEWQDSAATTALVGSANLSRAALLTSTRQGGNCELVAIHPVEHTLLPDGMGTATAGGMRTRSTMPSHPGSRNRVPLTLLGARWQDDTILVELHTAIAGSITVEMSPTGAPGSWRRVDVIDAPFPGRVETVFRADESTGGAVRARIAEPDEYVTSVAFLTDVTRCQPRQVDDGGPRLSRDYGIDDFINDPELADRLSNDLLRLMKTIGQHRAVTPTRVPPARSRHRTERADDRWGAWLDSVQRTLGPTFAELIFPKATPATRPETDTAVQWTIDDTEPVTDITDDENDEDVDPIADAGTDQQPPVIDPDERAAWRTRSERLRSAVVAEHRRPPLELRMGVTRIYIDLLAAGVWGPDYEEWRWALADVLTSLPPRDREDEDVPDTALAYTSSMIAVGLALLGQDTKMDGGYPQDVLWRSTWKKLRVWLPSARTEIIDDYLYVPSQSYARVAEKDTIDSLIELAVEAAADPHAETRATLDAAGLTAEFRDGVWIGEAHGGAVRKVAARIATIVGDPCAVIVAGAGKACAVLRIGTTLVMGERTPAVWHVMTMPSSVSTPMSLLTGADGLPSSRKRIPLGTPNPDVISVADALGIDLAQLIEAVRRWD